MRRRPRRVGDPSRPDIVSWSNAGKIVTVLGWLGGWALLTLGAYRFIGLWLESSWVWPVSGGLLLIGIGGLRPFVEIFRQGLWFLTNNPKNRPPQS